MQHLATVGLIKAGRQVKQGCLAAAATPKQHGQAAGLDGELVGVDTCGGAKHPAHVTKLDFQAVFTGVVLCAHRSHHTIQRPHASSMRSTAKPMMPMATMPSITIFMLNICCA